MTRLLLSAAVLAVFAFALSRVIAVGRGNPKTTAELKKAQFDGLTPRYRVTQPVESRKQWLRIERRRRKRA